MLAIGALAWLVKVALIAANGGENTTEGIVAVFFFVGFLGLFVGSASIGLRALREIVLLATRRDQTHRSDPWTASIGRCRRHRHFNVTFSGSADAVAGAATAWPNVAKAALAELG